MEYMHGSEFIEDGLDRLIRSHEAETADGATRAIDALAWKAHVRKHATFGTRCNLCALEASRSAAAKAAQEARAQQRKTSNQEAPSSAAAARAAQLAAALDDAATTFPYSQVSRTEPVGRLLAKWLQAARSRLGGTFPRPSAINEVESYLQQVRTVELAKQRAAKDAAAAGPGAVSTSDQAALPNSASAAYDENGELRAAGEDARHDVSPAARAVMQRWLFSARTVMMQHEASAATTLRLELSDVHSRMQPVDDWYYTLQSRLHGRELLLRGQEITDERLRLEGERDAAIAAVQADAASAIAGTELELQRLRVQATERLAA
ncbi:MAG: hypothetical protein EOO41_05670, partial [Methanobacteriota archaeon]